MDAELAVPPPLVPVVGRVVAEPKGLPATSADHVSFVDDTVHHHVVVHGLPSEKLAEGPSLVRDGAGGRNQPVPAGVSVDSERG